MRRQEAGTPERLSQPTEMEGEDASGKGWCEGQVQTDAIGKQRSIAKSGYTLGKIMAQRMI